MRGLVSMGYNPALNCRKRTLQNAPAAQGSWAAGFHWHGGSLITAAGGAGFFECLFDRFLGFPGALPNPGILVPANATIGLMPVNDRRGVRWASTGFQRERVCSLEKLFKRAPGGVFSAALLAVVAGIADRCGDAPTAPPSQKVRAGRISKFPCRSTPPSFQTGSQTWALLAFLFLLSFLLLRPVSS